MDTTKSTAECKCGLIFDKYFVYLQHRSECVACKHYFLVDNFIDTMTVKIVHEKFFYTYIDDIFGLEDKHKKMLRYRFKMKQLTIK